MFHAERQDTDALGWIRLLELIEDAAADGREVFKPLVELTAEQRSQVITLPPEIGAMESLEEFSPYTSQRLHWFRYEITRCRNLRRSTVSTRWIYGNYKHRRHFPQLADSVAARDVDFGDLDPGVWGATTIRTCSVCDQAVDGANLRQVWISLWTSGADILPLLVNACSQECVDALPQPAKGFNQAPHRGGPALVQPPAGHHPGR